jgi:hypothetical protein
VASTWSSALGSIVDATGGLRGDRVGGSRTARPDWINHTTPEMATAAMGTRMMYIPFALRCVPGGQFLQTLLMLAF